MQVGHSTGPMGFVGSGRVQLNPSQTVEKLLDDMKLAAEKRDFHKYDAASDALSVFVRAYVTPTEPVTWRDYKLTRSERIIADLLHVRLGKPVPRTAIMDAMYCNKADEPQSEKIIDIFICRLRQKLATSPYSIITDHGQGYRMIEKAA